MMKYYTDLTDDAIRNLNIKSYAHGQSKYKKDAVHYLNIPCAFDIEASSTEINGDKQAFMYIWMFGLGDGKEVYYGRNWSEFEALTRQLHRVLKLHSRRRLVVYVHNLAYEFQFIRKLFKWISVFSVGDRNPIKAITQTGIEFRDSYILSGQSLASVARNLINSDLEKLTGDLDYTLVRHEKTPLTEEELSYCEADIRILTAYIQEQIDIYDNITRIPATNTGRVRKYVRDECYYTEPRNHAKTSKGRYQSYRHLMESLTIKLDEYKMLKRAFAGGYTHANPLLKGKVLEGVSSIDFTSSYPAVMLTEQYPMSKAVDIKISSPADIEELTKEYCLIFELRMTGVRTAIQQDQYLSANKCYVLDNPLLNNGRVYSADILQTTVTDVDYQVIKQAYTWDTLDIANVKGYKKDYLPRAIHRAILNLYQNKTTLKGVVGRESDYMLSKGMLNSIYGMSVTDIVRVENIYTTEWTQEYEQTEKQLDLYNDSKSRFLFYPWGVWVTAYARRNLWTGILAMGEDYVYSDTDSIKLLNIKKHLPYINNYNRLTVQKLQHLSKIRYFDWELFAPETQEGQKKMIGIWDYEGTYDKFKTLGAKRYLSQQNDKLELTVAGLSKQKGLCYLLDRADGDIGKVFESFDNELYVPAEYTGKLLHTYVDTPATFEVEDYLGNISEVTTLTGVHFDGVDFTLSMDREVENVLGMLFNEGYLKEGSFYDGEN